MPIWFLKLWIMAQSLVGTASAAASGIISLLTSGAGFFIGSTDTSSTNPAAGGLNAIDVQSLRTASRGALTPTDIVIGSNSGVQGGTYGSNQKNNIIIGSGSYADSLASSTVGSNILIGTGIVRAKTTGVDIHSDSGCDVLIGNLTKGLASGGGNVFIGKSTGLLGAPTNAKITNSVMIGASQAITLAGAANASYASLLFLGAGVNVNGTISGSATAVGPYAQLGSTSVTTTYGAVYGPNVVLTNGVTNTTRIGNGGAGASGMAAIDMIAGSSVNTSLVVLGVNTGTSGNDYTALGVQGGANVAIAFALAETGKVIATSGLASYTIPDNTSLVIIPGTTNTAITFPANPIEGQKLVIAFDGAQTPTWAANTGQTLRTTPTGAVVAGQSVEYVYNLAANNGNAATWYRLR